MIITNNIGDGSGGGGGLLTQGEVHLRSLEHQMTHQYSTPANAKLTGLASQPQPKKRRNLPGTPDPSAEVIALSPKTLMATNRFVCEICNKGFQRDQNLQLHRRGHNLPWKLRQRTDAETRKRVYVCPEKTCVHHNPGRALGDLTGIKKHFCRKHGEKKWKCDKCARRYAVHSDWKAHVKTCGSREYKCDCGTIFSRRDSFITHRAFCDALAEENNKLIRTAPTLHHNTTPNPSMMAANTTTIPLSDYTTSLLPMSIGEIMSRSTPATSINFDDNMGWNAPVGASAGSSATALLQRATLMGSTGSGGDVNGGYVGLMHGNILDGVNCFGGDGGGVGVFASWPVGPSDGKSGSSRWCGGGREYGDDVMTVDFLGRRQQ